MVGFYYIGYTYFLESNKEMLEVWSSLFMISFYKKKLLYITAYNQLYQLINETNLFAFHKIVTKNWNISKNKKVIIFFMNLIEGSLEQYIIILSCSVVLWLSD